VTALDSKSPCALCSRSAILTIEPPRRTLGRGLDPDDPTYSVIAVVPDIPLCEGHAFEVPRRKRAHRVVRRRALPHLRGGGREVPLWSPIREVGAAQTLMRSPQSLPQK
jgi:hypothetical protein